MMISQSPSESSISMVVKKESFRRQQVLELSLLGRVIKKIDVKEDVAVIAVVGSGMRGVKGWQQGYLVLLAIRIST